LTVLSVPYSLDSGNSVVVCCVVARAGEWCCSLKWNADGSNSIWAERPGARYYSQVDMLGLRYKFVNFGAGNAMSGPLSHPEAGHFSALLDIRLRCGHTLQPLPSEQGTTQHVFKRFKTFKNHFKCFT